MNTPNTINVQEFLDSRPFSKYQARILFLCLSIVIMDGFDIVSMGFIAPSLVANWHVSRAELGPLMSMSLLGLALGGLFGGPLADRVGRRKVIVASVFFFGLMSLLSAWSPNVEILGLLRFMTGLGLGASQPNAATLASEYAPKKYRSIMVTTVYCGYTVGAAGGGFLSSYLIESHGWQSILFVGGVVPIAFSVVLWALLPESAKFLALRRGHEAALKRIVNAIVPRLADDATTYVTAERVHGNRGTVKLIISKPHTFFTLALWIGLFMNVLAVYFVSGWLPMMVRDQGFTISDAALVGAVMQVGGVFGNIIIGWEMDRWNPHKVMMGTLIAGGVMTLILSSVTPSLGMIMTLCFFLGFTINASNSGWTALATAYYPTEMRSTGISWMTGIGRFGAILGVSIGAVMLANRWTFGQVFLSLTVPIGIAALGAYLKGYYRTKRDQGRPKIA